MLVHIKQDAAIAIGWTLAQATWGPRSISRHESGLGATEHDNANTKGFLKFFFFDKLRPSQPSPLIGKGQGSARTPLLFLPLIQDH